MSAPVSDAWIDEGCAEVAAARAAGEQEIAAELVRFIEVQAIPPPPQQAKLQPQRCEACRRYYQPTRKDARFCAPACRKAYRTTEPARIERRDAHIQRMAEVLRKDPSLEAWQLRERFGSLSGNAIMDARRLAGVGIPEPWKRGRRR